MSKRRGKKRLAADVSRMSKAVNGDGASQAPELPASLEPPPGPPSASIFPDQLDPGQFSPEQSSPEQSSSEQSSSDQSSPEQSSPEQSSPEQSSPEQFNIDAPEPPLDGEPLPDTSSILSQELAKPASSPNHRSSAITGTIRVLRSTPKSLPSNVDEIMPETGWRKPTDYFGASANAISDLAHEKPINSEPFTAPVKPELAEPTSAMEYAPNPTVGSTSAIAPPVETYLANIDWEMPTSAPTEPKIAEPTNAVQYAPNPTVKSTSATPPAVETCAEKADLESTADLAHEIESIIEAELAAALKSALAAARDPEVPAQAPFLKAVKPAVVSAAEIEPKDSRNHIKVTYLSAETVEFIAQVERAKEEDNIGGLEDAAVMFLRARHLLMPSKNGAAEINHEAYNLVADEPSGGTKQAAGTFAPRGPADKSPSAPVISVQSADDRSGGGDRSLDAVFDAAFERAKGEEIQKMPLSQKSVNFIENLRESILNAGLTESIVKAGTKKLTERRDETQRSGGDWHSVEGQSGQTADEEGAARPALPPAALRKKKQKTTIDQPKLSLEDRLVDENIHAKAFEEEERIRLKQLKAKTTGGQYHVYLIIFASAVILAFGAQRFMPADLLHATNTAGATVTAAVNRLMPVVTLNSYMQGLRYYEDETTRGTTRRGGNLVATMFAGWDAAVKVATTDAPPNPSKARKYWFQLPTGFIMGLPAATIYCIRQICVQAFTDKSALEVLLIALMYLSMTGLSIVAYFMIQRRWQIFASITAPLVVAILISVSSIFIGSIMSLSESICRQAMPDTIQLFTAMAIIAVSLMLSRMSLFAPKAGKDIRRP